MGTGTFEFKLTNIKVVELNFRSSTAFINC